MKIMINMNNMSIENQHIFLAPHKDLGVGGWVLDNPYGVGILNPLEIIGRSLTEPLYCMRIPLPGYLMVCLTLWCIFSTWAIIFAQLSFLFFLQRASE